jgi:hypothetical protein
MVKKILILSGAGTLLGVLFFGRDVVSYVRTSAGYVTGAVAESVPIEFQIERARGMIGDLVPEIRKNMYVIAKEEVEVGKLHEQIEQTKGRLDKEKQQIMQLKGDLSGNGKSYSYAGRNYTVEQVKMDLANRFERYKTSDATLASLQQIHDARQKSLDAARQKLEGTLVAKRQLQVDVENLEARVQMIAAAKTTSQFQFDDSRLGRVKELMAGLKTRLDVAEKLVNCDSSYQGEIPLDATTPENIVDQVTQYFGDKTEKPAEVEVASVAGQ